MIQASLMLKHSSDAFISFHRISIADADIFWSYDPCCRSCYSVYFQEKKQKTKRFFRNFIIFQKKAKVNWQKCRYNE